MSLTQPKWNTEDRQLYEKLFYQKMDRELTEKEEDFVRAMYHLEEFACGLDGD